MSKPKATFRWTDADAILLIQLYKTYPFLWDSNHKLYKNSIARTHAYASIVEKMDKPLLTVKDIRSKIKNLRTSYYLEVKKMSKARQEMGLEYATKLPWFDHFKDIMDAVLVQKEVQSDSDDSFEFTSTNSDAYVVTIKQEYLDELEKQGAKNAGSIGDYLEPAAAPAPKRYRTKQGGFKEMKEDSHKEVSKRDREHFDLDEFQLFANNMAEQLRKLPIVKALSLQLEVQTLVARARIDMYKKQYGPEGKDDDE